MRNCCIITAYFLPILVYECIGYSLTVGFERARPRALERGFGPAGIRRGSQRIEPAFAWSVYTGICNALFLYYFKPSLRGA